MIQVRLKPEIEAALAAEAHARGIDLDRYIEEIVKARASMNSEDHAQRRAAVEAMKQFSRKHGIETGRQTIESMLHEGHKH